MAVKGYSRYRITAAFTGARGSTVSAWEVKANSQTMTDAVSTTGVLHATSRTVKVRVKDSRGRWSDTVSVKGPVIYDYGLPTVNAAEACRADADGNASDTGAYLRVKCAGSVYTCGGRNAKSVACRRRAVGGSWTGWTTLTDGTAKTINAGLSSTVSYEVQFRVSDSLGSQRTVTVTVPSAAVALNLRPGGRGAAFGKYAERDGALQLGWDLELLRPLEVSQGGTGQSADRVTETVTYDTSVASAHSVHVRRYPYLGMCFLRAAFTVTGQDVAANTFFTAAAVDPSLAPAAATALSVSASGGGLALMNSSGELRVAFAAAQTAAQTRYVYVSGWWIQQT